MMKKDSKMKAVAFYRIKFKVKQNTGHDSITTFSAFTGHIALAVILVVVAVLMVALAFAVYYHKSHKAKESGYVLHLPSVSFRDFLANTPGLRNFMGTHSGDQQGLVEEVGDEEEEDSLMSGNKFR